jgi:hypothetical protein
VVAPEFVVEAARVNVRPLTGRGRQIVDEAVQLGRGTRGGRRRHPLLEVGGLQPALREVSSIASPPAIASHPA